MLKCFSFHWNCGLFPVSVQLYFNRFTHVSIRLAEMASPTLRSHTATASEAITMKTLGTMSLMHDKDDSNYMCFTVPVLSRLVRRAETRTHIQSRSRVRMLISHLTEGRNKWQQRQLIVHQFQHISSQTATASELFPERAALFLWGFFFLFFYKIWHVSFPFDHVVHTRNQLSDQGDYKMCCSTCNLMVSFCLRGPSAQ